MIAFQANQEEVLMRHHAFYIFLFGTALVVGLEHVSGQDVSFGTIEGKVISKATGEPLLGVHVFLSGTKIGTVSDQNGNYRLDGISPGLHRIVASSIGFGRVIEDLSFIEGETRAINIELTPKVYELDEIYAGNLDEKWERHLERFTKLFIGESALADSVIILNPEVLRFDSKWWGKFTAEALAPLQIENRSLGYSVTYYLEEFYHTGTRTRWDGEPLFTELQPENEMEAQRWKINREKAYKGSLRHFLISLVEKSIEEDGFVVYHVQRSTFDYSPGSKFKVSENRLIENAENDHFYHVEFNGRLEIYYTEAPEDPLYVRWSPGVNRAPNDIQTSYLDLNLRRITIDADGEVKEPYGATRFGYFAFHRLADQTPREYRPESL